MRIAIALLVLLIPSLTHAEGNYVYKKGWERCLEVQSAYEKALEKDDEAWFTRKEHPYEYLAISDRRWMLWDVVKICENHIDREATDRQLYLDVIKELK